MSSAYWHPTVPPELRDLCEKACTVRQVAALQLKSHGYGAVRIGRILGVSEKAARGLLARAALNVEQEMAAQGGYGNQGVL